MRRINGRLSQRRTKCYVVEATVPDMKIVFDVYDEDIDVLEVERLMLFPTLAHGPEAAVRRLQGLRDDNIRSVRRIHSLGLLRAILTPDDEYFDLHRGELEESAGL